MNNSKKIKVFLTIAEKLNSTLNSKPIIYGSLGLSLVIDTEIKTDDIDLLIEASIFSSDLQTIHQIMMSMGYKCTDVEENAFSNGTFKIGIAHDGDLMAFCGVNPGKLETIKSTTVIRNVTQTVTYRALGLEDYLRVYQASSRDGYRKEKRMKNDSAKIALIKAVMLA